VAEDEKKKEVPAKKKRNLLHRIVNIFLYIGICLLLLLIVAFGITQTSTFREYLRGIVLKEANSALNGKIYFEKIEGTIFTSLLLRNAAVTMGPDTLLKAESIEVKTSPLRLLLKNIYVRKFELKNAAVSLIKDSSGEINLIKLFPPTEEDTTSSEFPFTIQVADFKLTNVGFSLRDYRFKNTYEEFKSPNSDKMIIRNINLWLSAFANIRHHQFALEINKFSFQPNISSFSIKNLSGRFYADEEKLTARDLKIQTESSDINLNAEAENFNIFDTTGTSDFKDALITLDLDASKFSFEDLSSMVSSTDILKGTLSSHIKAIGTLKDLSLKQLDVRYGNTGFSAAGRIQNVTDGAGMVINTEFENMEVDQNDINRLLPSLNIPVFKEYGMVKFDTLQFAGNPTNFSTKFFLDTDEGSLSAAGNMNFQKALMTYDLSLSAGNLNLAPVTGIQTDINSFIYLKGEGTAPENLTADVNITSGVSSIYGFSINSLKLKTHAAEKKIDYTFDLVSDSTSASLTGLFDFTDKENPAYKLKGDFNRINIAEIIKDTSARTNLNFSINASGDNFDLEKINLFLSLKLINSSYNNMNIDSTRAIVDLRRDEKGERIVNIISDLADITLKGKFNLPQTAELISEEIKFLGDAVNKKMEQMIPERKNKNEVAELNGRPNGLRIIPAVYKNKLPGRTYFNEFNSQLDIDYAVDLKNFELLSLFLGDKQVEIDGDIQGKLKSSADSIYFSLNSNLAYVKYWGKNDVFFLSNMKVDYSLANSLNAVDLKDIYSGLKFSTERIFTGSNIYNVGLDLDLVGNKTPLSFSGQLENYASVKFKGDLNLNENVGLNIDSLILTYNNMTFRNKNDIGITLSPDKINFENFSLVRDSGEIRINGAFSQYGNQNIEIDLKNINGSDLCTYLLNLRPENSLSADINLRAKITGNLDNPIIDLSLNADDVRYRGKTFGSLASSLNYKNKKLLVDTKFLKTIGFARANLNQAGKDQGAVLLQISGVIPIDLSLNGKTGRMYNGNPLNISLKADNFDLGAFGDVLPSINKLQGILSADLKLYGNPPDDISPSGFIEVKNASFNVEANNLDYEAGLKIKIEPGSLRLENLYIQNSPNTKDGGKMTGSGELVLNGFNIVTSQLSINGTLKVLSDASKTADSPFYGDLVIATNENVVFRSSKDEGAYLEAPVEIKIAKLTFPPARSGYTRSSENFIYKYAADEDSMKKGLDFDKLVELSRSRSETSESKSSLFSKLNYKIDVKVEDEATNIFVLSKEFNQNLTAVLSGNFDYEKTGDRPVANGELKLLEGSKLEFIKTLDAEGSIKFENDLSNPILDITATYSDYYYPADSTASGSESVPEEGILVAVKIKLQGPLKEMDKKLIQGKDNILVYRGEKNIENNEPDPTKDASDAVMFMILGKFKDEATQSDYKATANYAASVAGSVVGGFLNNQTNGVIKSVELRQTADNNTLINLGGKIGKFSYEFGTSTESFNDISQANFKINYPITKRLIGKVERKRALNETSLSREMVNEIGLRYRFEF